MKRKIAVTVAGLLIVALVVAACGGGGESPTATPIPTPSPTSTPTIVAPYDPEDAHYESYWYSRYNFSNLVTRLGMGIRLMPPAEKVMEMMTMAEIEQAPANPFLVQAVYASGDPHLVNQFNGDDNDFSNFRWDESRMDTTVNPRAMGYTMIKEVIWAKSFATDVEGASPMNHFRALLLSTEAAAQANFVATNLMSSQGLFVAGWQDGSVVNEELDSLDQLVMLWALSELANYATGKYGWYAAPLSGDMAYGMVDGLLLPSINTMNRIRDS